MIHLKFAVSLCFFRIAYLTLVTFYYVRCSRGLRVVLGMAVSVLVVNFT